MITKFPEGYERCDSCRKLFRTGLTIVATHRNGEPVYRILKDRCKECYLKRKQADTRMPAELYLIRLDRAKKKNLMV